MGSVVAHEIVGGQLPEQASRQAPGQSGDNRAMTASADLAGFSLPGRVKAERVEIGRAGASGESSCQSILEPDAERSGEPPAVGENSPRSGGRLMLDTSFALLRAVNPFSSRKKLLAEMTLGSTAFFFASGGHKIFQGGYELQVGLEKPAAAGSSNPGRAMSSGTVAHHCEEIVRSYNLPQRSMTFGELIGYVPELENATTLKASLAASPDRLLSEREVERCIINLPRYCLTSAEAAERFPGLFKSAFFQDELTRQQSSGPRQLPLGFFLNCENTAETDSADAVRREVEQTVIDTLEGSQQFQWMKSNRYIGPILDSVIKETARHSIETSRGASEESDREAIGEVLKGLVGENIPQNYRERFDREIEKIKQQE